MEYDIAGKKIIKIFLMKILTSNIINSIINLLFPVFISIWCINYNKESRLWWFITILSSFLILAFNIASIIARKKRNKVIEYYGVISKCYNDQSSMNNEIASSIFRLNNMITNCLNDKNAINRKAFERIADFQSVSFMVCRRMQSLLRSQYGDDIKCEVTLIKKENETSVRMIAYANNDNKIPSSYKREFDLTKDKDVYFIEIFNDLDGEICCLPNKETVEKEFKKLEGSSKRESEICQYIGIPLKTNRNEIEMLLQVDVSKECVFGKKKEQILFFAETALYPYCVLLHKAYERDLIFSKYYDMIITVLNNR